MLVRYQSQESNIKHQITLFLKKKMGYVAKRKRSIGDVGGRPHRPGGRVNWGRLAQHAFEMALPYAYNYLTTGKENKGKDNFTTNQYDTRTVYRKKSMPRKKKRVWRKFVKKVNSVGTQLIGRRTVLFNDFIVIGTEIAENYQGVGWIHLYGANGVNTSGEELGARDLRQIKQNDSEILPDSNVMMLNGVIDITMLNTDISTLEVDVYKIVYGKSDQPFANFRACIDAVAQLPINGLGQNLTIEDRGATPWDIPTVLSYLKAKILYKRKYLLGAGQSATYQHREPKNFKIKGADMDPSAIRGDLDFTSGYTTTFMIVSRNLSSSALTAKLRVGATRNYRYKVLPSSVNTSRTNKLEP